MGQRLPNFRALHRGIRNNDKHKITRPFLAGYGGQGYLGLSTVAAWFRFIIKKTEEVHKILK